MNGYYITLEHPKYLTESNGWWKKVNSQVKTLNNAGILTKKHNFYVTDESIFKTIKNKFSPNLFLKTIPEDIYRSDFFYIRYNLCSLPFLKLIKKIKQNSKAKIIIEIPTYPYNKEMTTLKAKLSLLLDSLLKLKLKKYVDLITTYSTHKTIFSIPAIQITNGIDCTQIPVRKQKNNNTKEINLIAVGLFSTWHGYDRLIKGLELFYTDNPEYRVNLHLIGDGSELEFYKELSLKLNLSNKVFFHGFLTGESINNFYDIADIAINSLGSHRINIFLTSALKSREYLARGLPIVSSTKIDIIPGNFKYCYYIPEDESPVDIPQLINFYKNLLSNEKQDYITAKIRKFAEENCNMDTTMKPVIQYLSGNIFNHEK